MASPTNIKILVAEDDDMQRMILKALLQKCEYDVTCAENGKIVMELLHNENNHFDLILSDLHMPEMDGFEVLKEIQEDERLSKIPVVVMSSEENDVII